MKCKILVESVAETFITMTAEECIEILRARGYAILISADSNELDLLKGPKNDVDFSMQGESLIDALRGAVELSGTFSDLENKP